MAEKRVSEQRSSGTILQDSKGAAKKFGFNVNKGAPITSAPKLSDMWFAEFISPSGVNEEKFSALAKSVSNITIQTTTQPIDKYGRRVYVPTRVDFPEIQFSFYDKVDGSTFAFAQELYTRHFKNQDMPVDSGLDNALMSNENAGRKIPYEDSHLRNFKRVTVYHWFGNQASGTGFSQEIILINPIVTSISFAPSDYASSEMRTVEISLQPENIVFGRVTQDAAIPDWMKHGYPDAPEADSLTISSEQIGMDAVRKAANEAQQLISQNAVANNMETNSQLVTDNAAKNVTQGVDSNGNIKEIPIEPDNNDGVLTGALTDSYSGTFIGGEPYVEGKVPMSEKQQAAIFARTSMGNEYPENVMRDYRATQAYNRSLREDEQAGTTESNQQLYEREAFGTTSSAKPETPKDTEQKSVDELNQLKRQSETTANADTSADAQNRLEKKDRKVSGKVRGLRFNKDVVTSPEYLAFLDPPISNTANSRRAARRKAQMRYKNAVIAGDIDPPESAKAPNYEVVRDE